MSNTKNKKRAYRDYITESKINLESKEYHTYYGTKKNKISSVDILDNTYKENVTISKVSKNLFEINCPSYIDIVVNKLDGNILQFSLLIDNDIKKQFEK